jgi:hypothetical protein
MWGSEVFSYNDSYTQTSLYHSDGEFARQISKHAHKKCDAMPTYFWVVAYRLKKKISRGYVIVIYNRVLIHLDLLTLSGPTSNLVRQYDFTVPLRCRKTSDTVFVAFVRPLSEPVRRFSSCSTDFSQHSAGCTLSVFLCFSLLKL